MQDLTNFREEYKKKQLHIQEVNINPIEQFKIWFKEAEQSNLAQEVNAMTLSTIDLDGYPKARVVLLKKYSSDGFVFFTNYNSNKGKSITKNPVAALSFFWAELERQIIIKGSVEKIDEAESEEYFNSRPKGSKVGAIVSNQSSVVESREILDEAYRKLTNDYDEKLIKRPKHWGGYLVKPNEIEFWQGRPNRLHDRIKYTKQKDKWILARLAP